MTERKPPTNRDELDSVITGTAMELLEMAGKDFEHRVELKAWAIAKQNGSVWKGGPQLYLKAEHVKEALASILQQHADAPAGLTDDDWLQIDQAARGCVSGTLREWPKLKAALLKAGCGLDPDSPGEHIMETCRDLINTKQTAEQPAAEPAQENDPRLAWVATLTGIAAAHRHFAGPICECLEYVQKQELEIAKLQKQNTASPPAAEQGKDYKDRPSEPGHWQREEGRWDLIGEVVNERAEFCGFYSTERGRVRVACGINELPTGHWLQVQQGEMGERIDRLYETIGQFCGVAIDAGWRGEASPDAVEFLRTALAEERQKRESAEQQLADANKTIAQNAADWSEVDDALEAAGVVMSVDGYRKSQVDAVKELAAKLAEAQAGKVEVVEEFSKRRFMAVEQSEFAEAALWRDAEELLKRIIKPNTLPVPAPAEGGKRLEELRGKALRGENLDAIIGIIDFLIEIASGKQKSLGDLVIARLAEREGGK